MNFSFAFQILLLLFFLGGAIAYIGNYVGRFIGRRRLTLLNLRPRYTATAITIFSGIIIALCTLFVVLFLSQDARIAMLGLEQLKNETAQKSKNLEAANQALIKMNQELEAKLAALAKAKVEIAALQKIKSSLNQEIASTRKGQFFFLNGDIISLSLIQGGPEKEKIVQGINKIIAQTDNDLGSMLVISEKETNSLIDDLLGEKKIFVVKLVADRNVLEGEKIPARFELAENRLIYSKDQEIVSGEIPSRLSAPQAEQEITQLLKLSHQAARQAGIYANRFGSVGEVPYSQIVDLAKKIKGSFRKSSLKIIAKKDIYVVGPLEVDFRVVY